MFYCASYPSCPIQLVYDHNSVEGKKKSVFPLNTIHTCTIVSRGTSYLFLDMNHEETINNKGFPVLEKSSI